MIAKAPARIAGSEIVERKLHNLQRQILLLILNERIFRSNGEGNRVPGAPTTLMGGECNLSGTEEML